MGLDMYWFEEPTNKEKTLALLEGREPDPIELGYFRKFHELNSDILEYLYMQIKDDGNCEHLYINQEFIDHFTRWAEEALEHIRLDPDSYQEEERDWRRADCTRLLRALTACQDSIDDGHRVYYMAWW